MPKSTAISQVLFLSSWWWLKNTSKISTLSFSELSLTQGQGILRVIPFLLYLPFPSRLKTTDFFLFLLCDCQDAALSSRGVFRNEQSWLLCVLVLLLLCRQMKQINLIGDMQRGNKSWGWFASGWWVFFPSVINVLLLVSHLCVQTWKKRSFLLVRHTSHF